MKKSVAKCAIVYFLVAGLAGTATAQTVPADDTRRFEKTEQFVDDRMLDVREISRGIEAGEVS